MWDISLAADVREFVPDVRVPTLVIHTAHNALVGPALGMWLAQHLPDATWCEIQAADQVLWAVPDDVVVNEIERFLTGSVTSGKWSTLDEGAAIHRHRRVHRPQLSQW